MPPSTRRGKVGQDIDIMLGPVITRVSSCRFVSKTRDFFVDFDSKRPGNFGQFLPRLMCTAEKANDDATKGDETESNEGELSELDKKIKLIEEKDGTINELEDKYKRALAESENVKSRMKKQVEDTKLFGIQGFAKDLLEVADILGKATESVPKEEIQTNYHLKTLYEGLLLTDQQLHKVFSKNGLQRLSPMGDKFDPNFHEALFEQDVPGKEGCVILVSQVGYTLNARVLRPAKVGVAKAKT